MMIPSLLLAAVLCAGGACLFVLVVRALRKYLRSEPVRRERAETRRSLGEAIRAHRMERNMT